MSLGLVFGGSVDGPHHPFPHPDFNDNCTLGVVWVWDVFHECVTTKVQYAGFFLGLFSILCWLVVFLPQFYDAYKNGKMDEAISPIFLAFWFLGDVSNLTGSLLSRQLGTQIAVAYYYIGMDTLVLLQFSYYYFKNRRKALVTGELRTSYDTMAKANKSQVIYCVGGMLLLAGSAWFSLLPWQHIEGHHSSRQTGRTLLATEGDCIVPFMDTGECFLSDDKDIIGYICGCISALFYLTSRVPQLYKNYKRKSVEGVAVMMFILTVMGNIFYGLSILMEDTSALFLVRHFPWLVGSLGTLTFDCAVLSQFCLYGKAAPTRPGLDAEENRGLLTPNVRSDDEGFYRPAPVVDA